MRFPQSFLFNSFPLSYVQSPVPQSLSLLNPTPPSAFGPEAAALPSDFSAAWCTGFGVTWGCLC